MHELVSFGNILANFLFVIGSNHKQTKLSLRGLWGCYNSQNRTKISKNPKTPQVKKPKPEAALRNKNLQFLSLIFDYFQYFRCNRHSIKHLKVGFSTSVNYVECMNSKNRKIGILNELPETRAPKTTKPATRDTSQNPKTRTI